MEEEPYDRRKMLGRSLCPSLLPGLSVVSRVRSNFSIFRVLSLSLPPSLPLPLALSLSLSLARSLPYAPSRSLSLYLFLLYCTLCSYFLCLLRERTKNNKKLSYGCGYNISEGERVGTKVCGSLMRAAPPRVTCTC
jgi:hypothetical protein